MAKMDGWLDGILKRFEEYDKEIEQLKKKLDKQIKLNMELDTELGKRNIELAGYKEKNK